MGYELIIFDFDGTICDSKESIRHCIKETFKTFKKPEPTEEQIRTILSLGSTLSEAIRFLFPSYFDDKPDELADWMEVYRTIYAKEGHPKIQIFPGTQELFGHMKEAGLINVVISNKSESSIENTLKKFDLTVDLIVGEREGIRNKPHPDMFTKRIRPVYAMPIHKMLMVGDTEADLRFAKGLKLDVCWARYGYGRPDDCRAMNPNFCIDSIKDLIHRLF